VPRRRVASVLDRELPLLQLRVGRHPAPAVVARQLVHRQVEGVEARQRHELELVAHRPELALETGDRRVVEVFLSS
jgi:hypothetical protein